MINKSAYQENKTILNVHVPNNSASKYKKWKLIELKGEIDKFTIAGSLRSGTRQKMLTPFFPNMILEILASTIWQGK